jgi:hypothetical protein
MALTKMWNGLLTCGFVYVFFQKKGRKITAEFDGASYKKGDVLEAMRPLRDYTN